MMKEKDLNIHNKKTSHLLNLIAILIVSATLIGQFVFINAKAHDDVVPITDPVIATPYFVVRNTNTGQVIYENQSNVKIQPASTVKLMVALIAHESLTNKSEPLAASKTAVSNISGNYINIQQGEEIKAGDLLAAVLISGANDATNVIAEEIAGTTAAFIKLMNEKAKQLGMDNTHYTNTTGFDDEAMYTTAADAAKLAEAVYKVNDLAVLANTPKYSIPATNKSTSGRNMLNKNHLVSTFLTPKYYFASAVGLNSGYTTKGGHCLITASDKDNLAYVYVFMGWQGPSKSANEDEITCYKEAKTLIEWTQRSFELRTIKSASEMLGEIKVDLGNNADSVVVRPSKDFDIIVDKRLTNHITYNPSIDFADESLVLEAPVPAGKIVGTVDILLNGNVIGTTDLITVSGVSRDEFGHIMGRIGDFFKSKMLKTIIIIFVSLIAIYILLSIVLKILNLVREFKRRKERKQLAAKRREKMGSRYDEHDEYDDYDDFDF